MERYAVMGRSDGKLVFLGGFVDMPDAEQAAFDPGAQYDGVEAELIFDTLSGNYIAGQTFEAMKAGWARDMADDHRHNKTLVVPR